MPVLNPFQPWTYQQQQAQMQRQRKPATTEEVKPPTAHPSPPPPTAGGGVVIQHMPGVAVGHGGVRRPPITTTGGSKAPTPPPGTGGGTKPLTTGGGKVTPQSIVQGLIGNKQVLTAQDIAGIITTLSNQINQAMQSGNYAQANLYSQTLMYFINRYSIPVDWRVRQSINTLINETAILSRLPQAPNVQPPRLSPQMLRALAISEPTLYTSMANVYYQNAYRQWSAYANQLNQLANQAQSMGLTDLANRLRAQANIANQMAQGYLTNYVLTSPNVTSFITAYNQYMQLLRNQPDPTTNPQGYLTWLGEVVAMSQQVGNAWQTVYPFLTQYQNNPQIQQLIQQGQYAQQVTQQVMQYAQQLQQNLLLNPSILNATPQTLTQLGSLGGVLTGSALMQSLTQLPPGTQIQIPYTPLTAQQGQRQNAWWSGLANWYQSQLELARQFIRSGNPLLEALGYGNLASYTLGSEALAGLENIASIPASFLGTMLVGAAEMPLIGARTVAGPRSPLTQFLLGVGVPLAQAGEFLQSSAGWITQQNMQAWQGVAPQWEVTIPGWARWATPLIEAFYPYVSNGRLVVSPGTVIGAVGYNLPLVLSGFGALGGAAKGVGLGLAGEETLAGELSPELSTRLGMWLAERAPWLERVLPRLGLTSERLIGAGSTLERVGAVGSLIDPLAWLARLTGEALAGGGELAARLGGRLERYALGGLARTVPEGTPEFYMLPRYAQYATALRNIGLDLLGAAGSTLARVGGLAQVIGRPLAEAFPMPWEYYTYRELFGEVGPLGEAVMPYTRPLTQELMDWLRGVRYSPFRFSFPLVIASPEVFAPYTLGARAVGRTAFEAGAGTITGIERFGWEIPIVYELPDGSRTGVTLTARVSEDGSTAVLTVPTVTEGGRIRWTQLTVPVNQLGQTVRDIAQRLAVQLRLPPGATPIFNIEPLYLFRIGTNVPGLGELTAFLTPQQLRQYRLLVGASLATAPNELVEMLGLTANANQVEALRNAYYTLLASLLGQPPEVLERNPQLLLLALGGGLATQYMRGLSPTLISDIMARTGRTPASLFYEWFQNVLPYIQQAQRNIIAPGVGIFELTSGVTPFGRVYVPYAFGLAEVPIGTRTMAETIPGSEIIGTGALLRTPEGLVVPGAGQLLGLSPTQLMGRLTLLNIDPYILMAMLSRAQQQLAELGVTYLPFRAVTEFGTPLYTRASTVASTNLLADWVRALMSAPYELIPPARLGELGTIEAYPYIARLTPGEAEALAESITATRDVPTGAAGIMALPQGVTAVRETPLTLEDLLSGMETTGASRYLSALVGLRLAEEAGATPIAELIPELARVGARAVAPTIEELQRQRRPVLPTIPGMPQIELPWFMPPGIRQWGGNLLTFSWYGPGRINVSPPGVLELLRALYPTGTQTTARQYYTQVSTPTLNTPTITIPTLPPITMEGGGTTTGQENPPLNPPTTATPIPPTATPPVPPFLIPLLWFSSTMPTQYPLPSELARPGAMREILVL